MKHDAKSDPIRTLNARKAAKALGVSYKTILNWIHASKIAAVRDGGELRVPIEAVTAILQARHAAASARSALLLNQLLAEWREVLEMMERAAEVRAMAGDIISAAEVERMLGGPIGKMELTTAAIASLAASMKSGLESDEMLQ